MEPPSTSFTYQPQSGEDVEVWILAMIRALHRKGSKWQLVITLNEDGEYHLECEPALANSDVGAAVLASSPDLRDRFTLSSRETLTLEEPEGS